MTIKETEITLQVFPISSKIFYCQLKQLRCSRSRTPTKVKLFFLKNNKPQHQVIFVYLMPTRTTLIQVTRGIPQG
jgi:hypothetical protein